MCLRPRNRVEVLSNTRHVRKFQLLHKLNRSFELRWPANFPLDTFCYTEQLLCCFEGEALTTGTQVFRVTTKEKRRFCFFSSQHTNTPNSRPVHNYCQQCQETLQVCSLPFCSSFSGYCLKVALSLNYQAPKPL